MTPLELSICLHYHSMAGDDPWLHSEAPIVAPTMASLVDCGLLTDGVGSKRRYEPTPKLHAFVTMLCDTPFPVQEWRDPRKK